MSDQLVRGNIQLRSGMNYNNCLVDQSIRSLYATNQFEFIEVKVEQADTEKVDVIFIIVPKYTIGKIEFNGNNKFSPERLTSKGEMIRAFHSMSILSLKQLRKSKNTSLKNTIHMPLSIIVLVKTI